jgi:hypothetical protein
MIYWNINVYVRHLFIIRTKTTFTINLKQELAVGIFIKISFSRLCQYLLIKFEGHFETNRRWLLAPYHEND